MTVGYIIISRTVKEGRCFSDPHQFDPFPDGSIFTCTPDLQSDQQVFLLPGLLGPKSLQIGEERKGGENEREKISSAEIVWTAVSPDDRRELKGTLNER